MKIFRCAKCKTGFKMPDNFHGVILCEDCDPAMERVKTMNEKSPRKMSDEGEGKK